MKRILTALLIFILSFNTYSQNQNSIYWTDSHKLSWDDFKGKAIPNNISAAMTYSSITFEIEVENDSAIITIENIFDKKQSWVKNSGKTNYILNHEQKHFDISEIYARKLRKKLSEEQFEFSSIQKNISKIVKDNYKEAISFQNKYDKETKHSVNIEKQEIWNEKIEDELKDFSNFTNSELHIFVKR